MWQNVVTNEGTNLDKGEEYPIKYSTSVKINAPEFPYNVSKSFQQT
jgi:hypothetical protein